MSLNQDVKWDAHGVQPRILNFEYRFESIAQLLHELAMTSITRQNLGEVWFRYLLAMRVQLAKKLDYAGDDKALRHPRSRSLPFGSKSLVPYIGFRIVGREAPRVVFVEAHIAELMNDTRNQAEAQASEALR